MLFVNALVDWGSCTLYIVHCIMSHNLSASIFRYLIRCNQLFFLKRCIKSDKNLNKIVQKFQTEDSTTEGPGSNEELIDSGENINVVKKQSLSMRKQDVEIESLSSEAADRKSDEWANIELGNVDEQQNTYYEVNNNENDSDEVENVTYDLTNDVAVNQMLADQGASYDPDAEVFDITQFEMNREDSRLSSPEEKEQQQESFDYLPYHHQTSDKRPTNDK